MQNETTAHNQACQPQASQPQTLEGLIAQLRPEPKGNTFRPLPASDLDRIKALNILVDCYRDQRDAEAKSEDSLRARLAEIEVDIKNLESLREALTPELRATRAHRSGLSNSLAKLELIRDQAERGIIPDGLSAALRFIINQKADV